MDIIVGLGNPGEAYENTRHNLGFAVVDLLAAQHRVTFKEDKKARALVAVIPTDDVPVYLIKPQTFMNLSGESVKEFVQYHQGNPSNFAVVCDDVDLEPGVIRIRPQGSSGGHKGIESIERIMGTPQFARIRIGIGKNYDPKTAHDYVLKKIPPSEKKILDEAIARAADGAWVVVREGAEKAMNRFNGSHVSD